MNIIKFNKLLTLGPRKCTVVFRPLRNCSSLTSRDEIYSESLETSEADHVSHLVDRLSSCSCQQICDSSHSYYLYCPLRCRIKG